MLHLSVPLSQLRVTSLKVTILDLPRMLVMVILSPSDLTAFSFTISATLNSVACCSSAVSSDKLFLDLGQIQFFLF